MNSNLSSIDKKYQNDMVVCVTEQSLNETFRRKLDVRSLTLNVYVFSYFDANGNLVYFQLDTEMDKEAMPELPEKLKEAINNANQPTDGENQTTDITSRYLLETLEKLCLFGGYDESGKKTNKDKAETAYSKYFLDKAYHFESPDVDDLDGIKIIDLKSAGTTADKCSAIYTQCFKEVEIIEVYENRGLHVNSYSQKQLNERWKVLYESSLYFQELCTDDVAAEIRSQIEENFKITEQNIDDIFEISRLIMDLSTLYIKHSFDISGLTEECRVWLTNALNRYVSIYLRCTSAINSTGTRGTDIGLETDEYMLTSKSQESKETCDYLFKPTKYCYSVSENNNNTNDGVKTLNYVLSTQSEYGSFRPENYKWNWITQAEAKEQSGVVSVSRDIIFEKFNSKFKDELLCLLRKKITPHLWEDSHFCEKVNINFNVEDDKSEDKSQFEIQISDESFKYIYPEYAVFGYDRWGEAVIILPIITKCWSKYSFSAISYMGTCNDNGVDYPAIIFEIPVKCSVKVEVNRATESTDYSNLQDVYDCVIKCSLGIKVDDCGKIEIVKKYERNEKQLNELELDAWGKISTLGTHSDIPGEIQEKMSRQVEDFINCFEDKFANEVFGTVGWMIGKKTFTYKDEQFSKTGDFMVKINYV